jgi:hypothetical protein
MYKMAGKKWNGQAVASSFSFTLATAATTSYYLCLAMILLLFGKQHDVEAFSSGTTTSTPLVRSTCSVSKEYSRDFLCYQAKTVLRALPRSGSREDEIRRKVR